MRHSTLADRWAEGIALCCSLISEMVWFISASFWHPSDALQAHECVRIGVLLFNFNEQHARMLYRLRNDLEQLSSRLSVSS